MPEGDRSPSPLRSNYDFTLRHERVKLFSKTIKEFDRNITRTAQTMRDVVNAMHSVGNSYYQVSQCVNNANPHGFAVTADQNRLDSKTVGMSYNPKVVANYGSALESSAQAFVEEMKSVRDGEPYVAYNTGVHKKLIANIHDVSSHAERTRTAGQEVVKKFAKLKDKENVVRLKEAKYERLGVPITNSKLYNRQVGEMKAAESVFQAKLCTFNELYEGLMQRQLYVTGHTLDDFLDINTTYLSWLLVTVGAIAPHGSDIVKDMIQRGADLGERLGAAPEERVGSLCRRADIPRLRKSAHNFTNYYDIRTDDDVRPSGAGEFIEAPMTARGMSVETVGNVPQGPAAAAAAAAPRGPPVARHQPEPEPCAPAEFILTPQDEDEDLEDMHDASITTVTKRVGIYPTGATLDNHEPTRLQTVSAPPEDLSSTVRDDTSPLHCGRGRSPPYDSYTCGDRGALTEGVSEGPTPPPPLPLDNIVVKPKKL